MNINQANEIIYRPTLRLRVVRLLIFCFSFFLGDQIVRGRDGKIPFFIMFLLPAVALIPLFEGFICKITQSATGIKVRNLTQNWSVDWSQITSWKYFNNSGKTLAGTHFTFNVGNRRYSLMELNKYSALKHADEIKNWIKIHINKSKGSALENRKIEMDSNESSRSGGDKAETGALAEP